MTIVSDLHWIQGIGFEVEVRDHHQFMDGKKEFGGRDRGPTPKEYVLAGLCGCTGMDVVSLLKKYKVSYETFDIRGETDQTTTHPIVFKEVRLSFLMQGSSVDQELYKKAVELSMTRYCGVSAMLVKAVPIHYRILLNGDEIGSGSAKFDGGE